jgi:hypothetical protein
MECDELALLEPALLSDNYEKCGSLSLSVLRTAIILKICSPPWAALINCSQVDMQ